MVYLRTTKVKGNEYIFIAKNVRKGPKNYPIETVVKWIGRKSKFSNQYIEELKKKHGIK